MFDAVANKASGKDNGRAGEPFYADGRRIYLPLVTGEWSAGGW